MINFSIKNSGNATRTRDGQLKASQYAETPAGKVLATISPRLQPDGAYSAIALNVCHIDGSVDIVFSEEEASEAIAAKLYASK